MSDLLNQEVAGPAQPDQIEQPKKLPVCPHCGADPAVIERRPLQFSGQATVHAECFYCGGCRKILSVQMVAIEPPRILRPGGH